MTYSGGTKHDADAEDQVLDPTLPLPESKLKDQLQKVKQTATVAASQHTVSLASTNIDCFTLEIKPTMKILEKITKDQVLAVNPRDKFHPRKTGVHSVYT